MSIKNLEFLFDLESKLKEIKLQENLKIIKYFNSEILIAPQSSHDSFEQYLDHKSVSSDNFDKIPSVPNSDKLENDPNLSHNPAESRKRCKTASNNTITHSLSKIAVKNVKVRENKLTGSSRWNTNSKLTEEQKTWIHKEAKKSAVKNGNKTSWKCSQCGAQMCSAWVLRKHLRDVHIIKLTKQTRDKNRGKDFMDEVRRSQEFENGTKNPFWKCEHCDNILKSESGFIKHLLYAHVKNSVVDPSIIADCKIKIENDDDRTCELGWRCPQCKKMYKTSTGLRNHFKLEHRDIDFGGEKYQKKIDEVSKRSTLLKAEEMKSEIILQTEKGPRKVWQCHRCNELRYFKSESGFRAHVRHFHLIPRNLDIEKIENCKTIIEESEFKHKLWKCPVCTKTMKTKDGFISHVTQEHPGEFDDDNNDESKCEVAIDSKVESIKGDIPLEKLAEEVVKDRRGALKVNGYKFSCYDCGLFFRKHYPTHVDAHKTLKHLAASYHHLKCEECQVIFCKNEAFREHLKSHVQTTRILEIYPSKGLALYGGKEFKTPTGSACADDAIDENLFWKCGHCCALFWEEDECVEHQLMMHVETLVCPIDQLTFSGNRGLVSFCSHMKNKHPELFPELKFLCTYCENEFSSIFDKLSHMKSCDAKKLECDGCGKKFFSKVKLAHHLKIEKGLLNYVCSVCGKKCSSSMDLKLHEIGSHTDSRLYQCTFQGCSKAFKTSASRSSHMETHSNISLQCSLCTSVFKKRVVLARHVKLIHDETYR